VYIQAANEQWSDQGNSTVPTLTLGEPIHKHDMEDFSKSSHDKNNNKTTNKNYVRVVVVIFLSRK